MTTRGAWRGLWGALALATACVTSDDQADARQQALAFAADDIVCETARDCCAVLDACRAQLLVVSAKDKPRVEQLLAAAPQDSCVRCVVPPVQVDCVEGVCVGTKLVSTMNQSLDEFPSELARTHCGKMRTPDGWEENATPRSSSGGATPSLQTRAVIGCE